MIQSQLSESLPLSFDAIAQYVPTNSPGVAILGYTDVHGRFYISYVGYAFKDLRQLLFDRIGTALAFKFVIEPGAEAVFNTACRLFHDFRPIGNSLHPERSPGTDWLCARCAGRSWIPRS